MLASLSRFGPELVLTGTLVLLLLDDLVLRGHAVRRGALCALALVGLVAAAAALGLTPRGDQSLFSGMIVIDGFARYGKGLFLVAAFFGVAFGAASREITTERFGEYLLLLLSLVLGLCLLAAARNLLMIYLALELVSLPSYVLAGFRRGDRRTSEAALKYVVYGGAASGLMLYGFSLLYGLTGTLDLAELSRGIAAVVSGTGGKTTLVLALLLSLAGFAYKISAVPFHMWCPDVYEGAPTPFTAFLSVGPKAAGFLALLRFGLSGFDVRAGGHAVAGVPWPVLVGGLAVATMTLGNLVAIAQDNVKRLLAYSSIAHAGYMLMAVAVGSAEALQAVLLYLAVYLAMNFGAFLAVSAVRDRTGSESLGEYRGLARRSPVLAVCLAIFLFSLTGLPPFAGFVGKFYLFAAVLQGQQPFFYVVALIGLLNSAVSLYYYARVVRAMYLEPAADEAVAVPLPLAHGALLVSLVVPTLLLGVYWAPLARAVAAATVLLH